MLQLDNFFAWITVDGRELTEYGVEYSEDLLHAICWIASEEQKNFVMHWRDSVRLHDSIGSTFVDGVPCGVKRGINHRGYRADPSAERDTVLQRGIPTSTNKDRLFMFSKLDLTDDDAYLGSEVPNLGEIKIEISYVKKGERQRLRVEPFQTETNVHEKTQKLAQHHTTLGGKIKGERKPTHGYTRKGDPRVFIFRYRPLDILQAKGIAPCNHEPRGNGEVIDLTSDVESDHPPIKKERGRKVGNLSMKEENTCVKNEKIKEELLIHDGSPKTDACKIKFKEDPEKDVKPYQFSTVKRETGVKQESYLSTVKVEIKRELKMELKTEEKPSIGLPPRRRKAIDPEIIDLT